MQEDYIVASTFPAKLLRNDIVVDGKIKPLHPQLNITNKCNRNCPTCCYKGKDNSQLSWQDVEQIARYAENLGTEAFTITGGGEPGCHIHLNTIIEILHKFKLGLVTNGYRLGQMAGKIDWLRISFSDDLKFLKPVIHLQPAYDISVSYIITANPDYDNLNKVISYAKDYCLSHIRIRHDVNNIKNCPSWNEIKENIIDWENIIFQPLVSKPEPHCQICFLRPVIGADNIIYPCPFHKVGIASNLVELYENQDNIDIHCDNCFYADYNKVLRMMKEPLKHRTFA